MNIIISQFLMKIIILIKIILINRNYLIHGSIYLVKVRLPLTVKHFAVIILKNIEMKIYEKNLIRKSILF